jgi:hypothetical protein
MPRPRCNVRRFLAGDEVQNRRVRQARGTAVSILVAVALATVGVLLVGKPQGVVIGAPVLVYAVAWAFGADNTRSVPLYFALAVTWAIAGMLLIGELLGAVIGAPVLVLPSSRHSASTIRLTLAEAAIAVLESRCA